MGGMDALMARAEVGVVLKATVMSHRALFCVHSRVVLINEDFPSQNATLPYVVIGSIAPRYICLRQSWLMLLIEFPSMRMASVAFEAFDAAILACSWNFRCRLNQSPRYLMQLDGVTSFHSPGLFDGMCTDGLLFHFLDFVKCISSFLTWSICSPLCKSHLCVSSNAIVFICVVAIRSGLDVRIAPSSTYSVHQQNMLMLQRPGRPGSTQEGWEQNSTFRSSLNTPGACQEWLGIVWRVCASSCQELRVPGRVRSNWPLQEQSQGS